MQERIYQIIGAASGWGAQKRACEEGPDALKAWGILAGFAKHSILYPKTRFREKNIPLSDSLSLIAEFNDALADQVIGAMQQDHFPVVIGGDHSVAVGTWNGVGGFLSKQSKKPLGLIWIDAHMDAHTPETTLSGAWHGMPLAALLGRGAKELSELRRSQPIVLPQHVCLIGIRSFEDGEAKLLKDLNVRIYFMEEVERRGLSPVLREAIAHVAKECVGYGVSLDIDVVDPKEAPGVGSPEPGGIGGEELLQSLQLLANDERLKAFEMVEFNPFLDVDRKTCELCRQILMTVLKPHHFAVGGMEHKIASGLPPDRNPNFVPRS